MNKKCILGMILLVLLISGCSNIKKSTDIATPMQAMSFDDKNVDKDKLSIEESHSLKTTNSTKTTTISSSHKDATTTSKPFTTTKILTDFEVRTNIESLKTTYPTGTLWNDDNFYLWKGGIYSGGSGCVGFAFMLSDAAFGTNKAKKIFDFNKIQVGDIIRYLDDTHSVVVLEVKKNSVIVAEGNLNGTVNWGREIKLSEIKETGTYILTRW